VVKSPEELSTLLTYLQSQETLTPVHLRLLLLHPLAKEATLVACGIDPHRKLKIKPNLSPTYRGGDPTHRDIQTINFTPLSDAWRAAWRTIPPSLISGVDFDVTLPAAEECVRTLDWAGESLADKRIEVGEGQVGLLVKSMAVVIVLKGKGTVKADLVHEPMSALDERSGGPGVLRDLVKVRG